MGLGHPAVNQISEKFNAKSHRRKIDQAILAEVVTGNLVRCTQGRTKIRLVGAITAYACPNANNDHLKPKRLHGR